MLFRSVTQTDEGPGKHPGQPPLTRPRSRLWSASIATSSFPDAFYTAREGLQRSNGLSISGGPDFLGIATWLFDVYLNERLRGGSATVAWQRVVNAIQSTDEWRSKH